MPWAIDGGGVRGLSSLYILQQLMKRINPNLPPKPCDCFDIICGTSTGGYVTSQSCAVPKTNAISLIAIMLGRLKMDVSTCIDVYLNLSSLIFQQVAHRVTWRGSIQARFDSAVLQRAIKDIIKEQGLDEEELFREVEEPRCKVLVSLQVPLKDSSTMLTPKLGLFARREKRIKA